jgi:DNA repair exonuclease SbcCD ATPase subunit
MSEKNYFDPKNIRWREHHHDTDELLEERAALAKRVRELERAIAVWKAEEVAWKEEESRLNDEIDRLREALEEIATGNYCLCEIARFVARQALRGDGDEV